jgi:hypothetical protein
VVGVDVKFVVDVLNVAVATSVGVQLDVFGSASSAVLVTELQSSGLTGVTGVTLIKGAATNAPPPPQPPVSSSSSAPIAAIAGAVVGFVLVCLPGAVLSIMAIFFKPVLRRKLLQCGWKRLANLIVPDLTDDVHATSMRMIELVDLHPVHLISLEDGYHAGEEPEPLARVV